MTASRGLGGARTLASAIGGAVVALIVVFSLLSLPHGSGPAAAGTTPTSASCRASDPRAADPNAPHGLFVLSPPAGPHAPYYADTMQYLLNNTTVCGADFWIHWDSVDMGPTAALQYNWSSVTATIAPWLDAGKEVNLIMQMVGYGPNETYVPSYVLDHVPTMQCANSSVTPVFWNATVMTAWQAFMRATVTHFGSVPGIGYVRFGLGTGGETFPLLNITEPGCGNVLNSTGYTNAIWENYIDTMLAYEKNLDSPVQLMVALNGPGIGGANNVSANTASMAARDGVGFGSEGLELENVQYNATGAFTPCDSWCKSFDTYAGEVPLELQTDAASEPNGSGPIGSLTVLLPYSLSQHTQIFELYFDDWLTALDPNYPAYGTYHAAYDQALWAAAETVGFAP